ncbi:LPO_1073/Vpar_1526 family protein [Pseudomonas sp.]|uniref:LPO_1073/Vpar_1526 family protein n=1 Tax=Pseudomonas sp. TaxID=306 RepID=UPI0028982B89|nr:LPO_1073/Vpar_1526 family protein [Pseudomonas sp.]
MFDKGQSQNVGDGSNVIQGGNDVNIHMGLSYSDARSIALDVAKSTFHDLAGEAKILMSDRVEEITEAVISRLSREYSPGLDKAKDPDFQFALLSVQREYGRCGDQDLGKLLVDLLVDRSKEDTRSLKQIVLNESLQIAPKLTQDQISALSLIFLLRNTINNTIVDYNTFGAYLDGHIQGFIDVLPTSNQTYQHLEFTGCGTRGALTTSLHGQLQHDYPGLFHRGYTDEEMSGLHLSQGLKNTCFVPCLADPSKKQFAFSKLQGLTSYLESIATPKDEVLRAVDLYKNNIISDDAVKQICIDIRPYMSELFNKFETSDASAVHLTSVGIAIAHANLKSLLPRIPDLSVWI